MSNVGPGIVCVFAMTELNRQILHGDVLEKIKEIPNDTIDCIITSPPYWGLRDYSVKGQLGLEPDFKDFLKIMKKIMDECKRVLKPTGSCWINLGDTYAVSGKGIIAKSRVGIPERFYIQCIDDGWIARNHIPWVKGNPMPSSVKDRFANKWESIFFFVKSQKYYFNLDAVREKTLTESKPFNVRVRDTKNGHEQSKLTGGMSKKEDEEYNSKGERKDNSSLVGVNEYLNNENSKYIEQNSNSNNLGKFRNKKRYEASENKTTYTLKDLKQLTNIPISDLTPFKICELIGHDPNAICPSCSRSYKRHATVVRGTTSHENYPVFALCNITGKNPGDIFYINTQPFTEAHFATFPVALPLKILKCSCPPDGIVLDPFFGAGTTGVAAEKLGLQWVGIELNDDYIKIAKKRLIPFLNDKIENNVE